MQRNKFVLLLVIYVAGASSQELQTTTELEDSEGRIVGGSPAAVGQFPHMVSLRVSGSHICGGAIISKSAVLTAAHCVEGRVSNPSVFTVHAGSLLRSSGGTSVGVSRIIVHPNYNNNIANGYDVAVLTLATDLTFSSTIQLIALATSDPSASRRRTVTVSGWGRVSTSGPLSERLLYLNVQPLTRRRCRRYSSVFRRNTIICFRPPRRRGTCFGDSGSPAIYRNQIVGITSFIIGRCANRWPDGYARISKLRSWISNYL